MDGALKKISGLGPVLTPFKSNLFTLTKPQNKLPPEKDMLLEQFQYFGKKQQIQDHVKAT